MEFLMFKEKYTQENEKIFVGGALKNKVKGFEEMNARSKNGILKACMAGAAIAALFALCALGVPQFAKRNGGERAPNAFSIAAYAANNSALGGVGNGESHGEIEAAKPTNPDGEAIGLFIAEEVKLEIFGDNLKSVALTTNYGLLMLRGEGKVGIQYGKTTTINYPEDKVSQIWLVTDVQDGEALADKLAATAATVTAVAAYTDGSSETKTITIQ
jgi:hypothetical protein